MKKLILIGVIFCLIGILMDPIIHLYGMRIKLSGDLDEARKRVHLANLLRFKTQMVNVNNLDIVQNFARLADGTRVRYMGQHGLDWAEIYVPPGIGPKKPRYERSQRVEYFPYIPAYEGYFDQGGLLVCLGGLDFSGGYELISPHGPSSLYQYQPFGYTVTDGEYTYFTPREYYGWFGFSHTHTEDDRVVEYQTKNYYDPTRTVLNEETGIRSPVLWDEYPWMGDCYSWDPVFYENYIDAFDSEGEPLDNKPYKLEQVYTSNEFTETWETKERSDTIAVGPLHGDENWELERHVKTTDVQYNMVIADEIILSASTVSTEIWQQSSWEYIMSLGDSYLWQEFHAIYGFPPLPDESDPFWYSFDFVKTENSSIKNAIDQTDPTKWAVLYNQYFQEQHKFIDYNTLPGTTTVDTYVSTWAAYVKGLGHEIKLFDEQYTRGYIRLYKINDKYICLFSAMSANKKVIGSFVEGGDAHIVDVTDGMMVNGELRTIMSRSAKELGLIMRQEPEKVVRVE